MSLPAKKVWYDFECDACGHEWEGVEEFPAWDFAGPQPEPREPLDELDLDCPDCGSIAQPVER